MSQNQLSVLFNRFSRNIDGNVAILFSLATVPMMLFAGVAVDYSNAALMKAKLQSAADSVALSLINEPQGTSTAELQKTAEKRFSALMRSEAGSSAKIAVSVAGKAITVSARASLQTSFLRIVQQNEVAVGVNAVATYGRQKLQIALVLDNTGSMGQMGKMAALKQATNDLLDKLKAINVGAGDIKVSLVPFNTQVRLETSYSKATWLRWDVRAVQRSLLSGRFVAA